MPEPARPPEAPDLVALVEWIDQIADRFEAAWRDGGPPRLPDFLGDAAGTQRLQLLKELVRIDLEYRRRRGLPGRVEDYVRECPELLGPEGLLPEDLVDYAGQVDRVKEGQSPEAGWSCSGSATVIKGEGSATETSGPPSLKTLGKFQLLEVVGQGAFGTVYKARDDALGRIVAVKLLRTGAVATAEEQERFLREARSAAQLKHPNIVEVYEVTRTPDGVPFIVSEFIEGRTLADLLRAGPPDFPRAAELAAQLAETLDYAHRMKVIHRDLKPANILIDAAGRPHLADFGLARCAGAELTLTAGGQVLGTPAYMSPEQAAGYSHAVDNRSDVYSLGVILYELLTGRRPFLADSPLLLHQVVHEEPRPPRKVNRRVPRDLETICLKAMAKAPGGRYATAGDLAADLRRFLANEPIRARPTGRLTRLARWCRRNPVTAGLLALVFVLLAVTAGSAVLVARASLARERERAREVLLQKLQLVRLTAHQDGWSRETWRLVGEAGALQRDEDLRDQATAVLAGLDAVRVKRLGKEAATTLAFSPDGRRLLLGGLAAAREGDPEETGLWERAGDRLSHFPKGGEGPVAFGPGGTALQLTPGPNATLLLRDLARGQTRRTYRLGAPAAAPWARNGLDLPVLALSPDQAIVAASASREGKDWVAVWQGADHVPRHLFPGGATALALSRGGEFLAAGDAAGRLRVWSLDGKLRADFPAARTQVHSLAFAPDGRRLAVGEAGGLVTVWDWRDRRSLPCHGSSYDVYAVAFSPDGTLLASGGRGAARVWDAATGRALLGLNAGDYTLALTFSADGRHLALSSQNEGVTVWDLQPGRGVRTLHGLASPVARVWFSPDGRLLAALEHNWQVAVWDVQEGRLLHRFDAPHGRVADNAALAFRPDNRQLAFCTWTEARLWDLDTGRELRRWENLPPGLGDLLAFHPSGKLLLFRCETRGGGLPPFGNDPRRQPRVFPARDLLGPDPRKPLFILKDFDRAVFTGAVTSDGGTVIVEGIHEDGKTRERFLKAFDGLTGRLRWAIPSSDPSHSGVMILDPTGEYLSWRSQPDQERDRALLVHVPTGKILKTFPFVPFALSPGARTLLVPVNVRNGLPGFALYARGESQPQVTLRTDTARSCGLAFDRTGALFAWGNPDGTVNVCRLKEVREQLAEVRLGW